MSVPKMSFESIESYKHLYAKNLLKRWFLDAQNSGQDPCSVAQFKWRPNYGVFTELPFYETCTPYYFENSAGLKPFLGFEDDHSDKRGSDPLNWFDPHFDRGKILFVPDICIFHKGTPLILIEVVHKSPVTDWKLRRVENFFVGYHVELYEVEAEEILKNIHPSVPNKILCRQLI